MKVISRYCKIEVSRKTYLIIFLKVISQQFHLIVFRAKKKEVDRIFLKITNDLQLTQQRIPMCPNLARKNKYVPKLKYAQLGHKKDTKSKTPQLPLNQVYDYEYQYAISNNENNKNLNKNEENRKSKISYLTIQMVTADNF